MNEQVERDFRILEEKQYPYEPSLYADMEDTQKALRYYLKKFQNDKKYTFALANAYTDAAKGVIEDHGYSENYEITFIDCNGTETTATPDTAIRSYYLEALALIRKLEEEHPNSYDAFYSETYLEYAEYVADSHNSYEKDIKDAYEQALASVKNSDIYSLNLKVEIYESLLEKDTYLCDEEKAEYASQLSSVYEKLLSYYNSKTTYITDMIKYWKDFVSEVSAES